MSGRLSTIALLFTATGVILAALAGAFLAFIPEAKAADAEEHLVTIHDRGKVRTILTRQTVLGDALKEADYNLDANDLVEPGLDEELVSRDYQVNIYRARPIVIQDGNVKQLVMSAYQTPKQVAKHVGITLQDEDEATLKRTDSLIRDGASTVMQIDRATPLKLILYGKKQTVYTQATTVADFLKEKDITLAKQDTLSVKAEQQIAKDMKIEIWRNGKQTVTRDEAIDFEIEQIEDKDRPVGYKKITEAGVKGKKSVTYEITMKNGKELKRKKIQSVVIKKPSKQMEVVGAKIEGPESIISKIEAAADAKGIDEKRVLLIARCESGFNPRANSGYYKGIFQHDPNYWAGRAAKFGHSGASIFDVDAQIAVSTGMMAQGGWSHWGCDPGPQ